MHGQAPIVQQHPGTAPVPLSVQGLLAGLLRDHLFHIVNQGVDLRIGRAGGQDKVVRQGGQVRNLQHLNLPALFLRQRLGRQQRQFLG